MWVCTFLNFFHGKCSNNGERESTICYEWISDNVMRFHLNRSPVSGAKSSKKLVLHIQIFLNLLSHVENGTVTTAGWEDFNNIKTNNRLLVRQTNTHTPCTQHIFMQAPLTALTLSPESREFFLKGCKVCHFFLVDLWLTALTMLTHCFIWQGGNSQ